ncbi:MAG: ABC-type transporter Mla MlaB component [Oceanicoccus sp.]|jgi:ABC-type transporter Mla MlaB component
MTDKTSFLCGELLDVTVVNSLHSRLQKSLIKSLTIELKVDTVQKTDTAGLQLFIALKNEISKTGGRLIWKNPSQILVDSAILLGLDKELGLS